MFEYGLTFLLWKTKRNIRNSDLELGMTQEETAEKVATTNPIFLKLKII